jgi:hypothetical protein
MGAADDAIRDPHRLGRLVWFLRRERTDGWRVRLLMNSHSRPMEPIP